MRRRSVTLPPALTAAARRYVFGFRGDVRDNVHYAEDGSVVYPSGHNVVLFSPDVRQQRLIPGTLESEGITALCVSGNKKLLAVAERSEKAMINVYDLTTLKRRKVLLASDAGSKVRTGGAAGWGCWPAWGHQRKWQGPHCSLGSCGGS